MVLLDLVVRKTMIGMAMRAISWDKFTVPLMGISVDTIISITFILGASLPPWAAHYMVWLTALTRIWGSRSAGGLLSQQL